MPVDCVFLSRFNTVCGISTYTENLAKSLISSGLKVAAIASDHAKIYDLPARNDIDKTIPCFPLWAEDGTLDFAAEAALKHEPRVIHIQHEFGVFRNGSALKKFCATIKKEKPDTKLVITLHTVHENTPAFLAEILSYIDVIIVHNRISKQLLLTNNIVRHYENVRVIHHGMVFPAERKGKEESLQYLGLEDKKGVTYFLSLGFISIQKKHGIMLQALDALAKKTYRERKKVGIIIAGLPQPKSGGGIALINSLCKQAKEYGIQNFHLFDCFIQTDELPYFYGAGDICLHVRGSSGYSSSGSIRLDLSYGMPTLVQKSEITKDLPVDTVGFFETPFEIVRKMEEIYHDDDLRERLAHRAQELAEKDSWRNIGTKHLNAYF